MSNYEGAARSNYFQVKDSDAFEDAMAPFDIEVSYGVNDTVCLLSQSEGGWPNSGLDDDDNQIDFTFEAIVCPHMRPGQVLVCIESGHEKLRFVGGQAVAFNSEGASVAITLYDIYDKAAAAFGVARNLITTAEY